MISSYLADMFNCEMTRCGHVDSIIRPATLGWKGQASVTHLQSLQNGEKTVHTRVIFCLLVILGVHCDILTGNRHTAEASLTV